MFDKQIIVDVTNMLDYLSDKIKNDLKHHQKIVKKSLAIFLEIPKDTNFEVDLKLYNKFSQKSEKFFNC